MSAQIVRYVVSTVIFMLCITSIHVHADEGMWQPNQLPQLRRELRTLGLAINPNKLSKLDQYPMNAVISLGGCSASFVSPQGLVVTNHHCAYGSIQYNSNEDANFLEDGFLAATQSDELQAAPGSRIYVTVAYDEVTDVVLDGLSAEIDPRARYQAIEDRQKAIIASCEQDAGHRCRVASFHGGLEYFRIKQLEIQDVRLVYAPSEAIGRFGGDIDNWQWPRHTGDFAFYRAYVAPDGTPAPYSEKNVAFTPPSHLKVATDPLKPDDFVMVAGYPGVTNRYRRLAEVEHQFGFSYPTWLKVLDTWLGTIDQATENNEDAQIKYASLVAGLNNFQKNTEGQIEGALKVDLLARRQQREQALDNWVAANAQRKAQYAPAIQALDNLVAEVNATAERDFYLGLMGRSAMLATARTLYRYAQERAKPDAQREPGYQDRDRAFIAQRMQRLDRRFDPSVDQAVWLSFLESYVKEVPQEQRVSALDETLELTNTWDAADVATKLANFYSATTLTDPTKRMAYLDASAKDLDQSDDPFIQLAAALYDFDITREEQRKRVSGRAQTLRPEYMEAIIAFQQANGQLTYPDANSTLRVTYGTVKGVAAGDGLYYTPFTTLRGIAAKFTGTTPFDSPKTQLDKIEAEEFGNYGDTRLNSVPVNFLSTLDATGGNSGSPTLNGKGELVGLLFDGTYESINSDWDFDETTTRSIHVDTRYMLWVMREVDGADHLLVEMGVSSP